MTTKMQNILSAAEMVYKNLSSSNNSLRRTNAHYVKIICDQMAKDKVEITLSSVAQRCIDQFGQPATSTITNTGSMLGEYIRQRRNEQHLEVKRIINDNYISKKLSDPILAQEVKILEESTKQLRIENNALRNTLKLLSVDLDNELKSIFVSETSSKQSAIIKPKKLNNDQSENTLLSNSLLKLLDHLASRNYQQFRGRYGLNKKTILTNPEFEEIKKYCNISESEWIARYGSNSD